MRFRLVIGVFLLSISGCMLPASGPPQKIKQRDGIVVVDLREVAQVRVGGGTWVFDSPEFTVPDGMSLERVIDLVLTMMQADIDAADLHLTIDVVRPGDDPMVEGGIYRLFFGGVNASYLGLADVSGRNQALIFTDWHKGKCTSETRFARSIANIAGHELGHLLGLQHSSNAIDLMVSPPPSETYLCWMDLRYVNVDVEPVNPNARSRPVISCPSSNVPDADPTCGCGL